jgi:hypothetical protein
MDGGRHSSPAVIAWRALRERGTTRMRKSREWENRRKKKVEAHI